jgi:pyruvate/2-oxoglutarate dehydrogenase complex dihydrolipoamide acyltransferase (E2) component
MSEVQQSAVRSHYFDIQRRVVAHKTVESWQGTPHAAVALDLDVTRLLSLVNTLKASPEFSGVRVTINSLLLKIIAQALRHSPEMNAHIEYNRRDAVGRMTFLDQVNVAVPFRTHDGRMITPVVDDVGRKSLFEVCRAMDDLKRRVDNTNVDLLLLEVGWQDSIRRLVRGELGILRRLYANLLGRTRIPRVSPEERLRYAGMPHQDRITPENLVSATVLVSNIGSLLPHFGAAFLLLEVIAPQTTAIGLGSIVRKPLVVTGAKGEEVAIRSVLPMSICFDHRAMDVEHIRGFVQRAAELCADPQQLIPEPKSRSEDRMLSLEHAS